MKDIEKGWTHIIELARVLEESEKAEHESINKKIGGIRMKVIKRIIGALILLNIAPCLLVLLNILVDNPYEMDNLNYYLVGLFADLTVIAMYYIMKLILWCFDMI